MISWLRFAEIFVIEWRNPWFRYFLFSWVLVILVLAFGPVFPA